MLKLGHVRVIDAQMQTFILAGVDVFSFVVGHGARRVATHLFEKYPRLAISVINNNHFTDRNLDWSAYLALSSRDGDAIYYEGDVIAASSIIRELATHPGQVCVAMDSVGQSAKIDATVVRRGNRVRELRVSEHGTVTGRMGKSEGEFLCLVKLGDQARKEAVRQLKRQTFTGPMKLYDIFNDLFEKYRAYAVSAAGRPWVEIDNKADLRRATRVVHDILTR